MYVIYGTSMINFDRTKRKNKIIAAILKSFTVAGVGWQWRNKKLPMGIASTGYYRRRASDFDFFNVVSPFVEEFLRYLFRNYGRSGLKSLPSCYIPCFARNIKYQTKQKQTVIG